MPSAFYARGRDDYVIFIPPVLTMQFTAQALTSAGLSIYPKIHSRFSERESFFINHITAMPSLVKMQHNFRIGSKSIETAHSSELQIFSPLLAKVGTLRQMCRQV